MVQIDKIYTRAGDRGQTRLATGEQVDKWSLRVEAYGAIDETNSFIGLARIHTQANPEVRFVLDTILSRIQNDLFDLGADLATPERDKPVPFEALRIQPGQVERLEREIDLMNEELSPLNSFVLPGGSAASAALHVARAVSRRAERLVAQLSATEGERVSPAALHYANRLSDLLFTAARWANDKGAADVLWVPGANR